MQIIAGVTNQSPFKTRIASRKTRLIDNLFLLITSGRCPCLSCVREITLLFQPAEGCLGRLVIANLGATRGDLGTHSSHKQCTPKHRVHYVSDEYVAAGSGTFFVWPSRLPFCILHQTILYKRSQA